MKMLDLFSGAGGAAKGYQRAGFYVVGVDNRPQPRYCGDEFIQADALECLAKHGDEYDFIHASPPCQIFSALKRFARKTHKALIQPVRLLLIKTGRPYVIENVCGAPLVNPIMLCGSMFNLCTTTGEGLKRHRLFESNIYILNPHECNHAPQIIGIFGNKARNTGAEKRHYSKPKKTRGKPTDVKRSLQEARDAMGIDWMDITELCQAIPPAYTEFIGKQIIAAIKESE